MQQNFKNFNLQNQYFIKIEADEKIEWIYPSLIEIDTTQKALCNIQFAQKVKESDIVKIVLD